MKSIIKPIAIITILFFVLSHVSFSQEKSITDGIKLFTANHLDEADKYFNTFVNQHPNHTQGLYYLARVKFEKKELDKAENWFKKCLKIEPNNAEFTARLGWTYLAQSENANMFSAMSKVRKGIKTLEKSIEIDPYNQFALIHLAEFYVYAPSIIGGGIEKGRKLANRLMPIDEIEAKIIFLLIQQKEGNKNKTCLEYKLLADQVGNKIEYAKFYNQYGYYLLDIKKYNEAIIQFEKLIQLQPTDPNSHDSLGDGYYAAGRLKDAKRAYMNTLAIDANFESSKKSLAKVQKKLKRKN